MLVLVLVLVLVFQQLQLQLLMLLPVLPVLLPWVEVAPGVVLELELVPAPLPVVLRQPQACHRQPSAVLAPPLAVLASSRAVAVHAVLRR